MDMFEAIKLNLKRKSRVLFGVYVCMYVGIFRCETKKDNKTEEVFH